ncbi:MAG TPA: hypothetical protein VLM11_10075 [Streptosporangiaceae bacterium]|nr:hypothetical protein [Streptosporangiaceae bacterium]
MSPRTDRLSSIARDRGKHLVAAGTERMASTLRSRSRPLVYAGTALAVAGVGSTIGAGSASAAITGPAVSVHAGHAAASHAAAGPLAGNASVAALKSIPAPTAGKNALQLAPVLPPAQHVATAKAASKPQVVTWTHVRDAINQQTNPAAARLGQLPAADRLTPVGTSGPQSWMPISPAQMSNATAIVQQALSKKMGIRSAVIAVATAMQESQLLNLHYGDLDSRGLFQQRPSMGWGTAAQVTTPSYAAGAFLGALHQHQSGDPTWAMRPLWASAQAVQKSGFPFAYAKWESQAAGLVKQIAMRLR